MGERDGFKSRMGFLLVSAGCAIGIGNVWKFPYIAGQYGGAVFVHDNGIGSRTRKPPERGTRL